MDNVIPANLSRRDFLKASGAFVVSFSFADSFAAEGVAAGPWPAVIPPESLDSWIAIGADGVVNACIGKVETGMGISTAFMQIVAEELDVALDRVVLCMGDTATTVDQRGTGSSNGIMVGGSAIRNAAAQARATLLAAASEKLGAPAEKLRVKDGVVSVAGAPSRHVSYADLVGGKPLEAKVGKPKTKDPREYTIVGKPVPRVDIPPKLRGEYRYITDLRVDGMLHGRVIRPPQAGAKILSVDESAALPGLVKVVRRGDFLGVVCEREEQAIEAARALPVKWSEPEQELFSADYDALYERLRGTPPRVFRVDPKANDARALSRSTQALVDAYYEYPFQSHASMGPACAVADVRDGVARVWWGGQKPYALRLGLAELLALPVEKVRVAWQPGPGSYGQNEADDCAADCALLSQAVGRPVRLQYMRADATQWDPKAPPIALRLRAGLASGEVVALNIEARGYSGRTRPSGSDTAGDFLAGQLMGLKAKSIDLFQVVEEDYAFGSKYKVSYLVDWRQALGTPLRTSHLRDPDGMAKYFAFESFVDEIALATKTDPVQFRLRYLQNPREAAVVKAAAEKAGWETRVGPRANDGAKIARGRGIAFANRNGTLVAIVAEVDVDRATGQYRVRRFTCAHDCGFVINPLNLKGTIEANLIQSMSRAKHEAVRFDATRVTSTDWLTYPIVDITEVPDTIEIVLLNNRPEVASTGAGEPATRPMAAALANALFDATGVRLRRVPLTPESLLAGMKSA